MRRLHCLAHKLVYQGTLTISDAKVIKDLVKESAKEYALFRQKAHEFRWTYLGRIADELSMEDSVSAESHF